MNRRQAPAPIAGNVPQARPGAGHARPNRHDAGQAPHVGPVAGYVPQALPAAGNVSRGTRDSDRNKKKAPLQFYYDWENAEEIGRGGFGVVYKVVKTDFSARAKGSVTVAIKCVDKGRNGAMIRDIELRALTVLAKAKHPHIVQYFGKFDYEMNRRIHDCYEFEFVGGGDLFHFMWAYFTSNHSIRTKDIAHFATQILRGLQFIHEKGFAHRDIKPENIMLTAPDYGVKITDFGISMELPAGSTWVYVNGLAGTPPYIAPEAYTDSIQGHASDIWAVGVTIFSMFFKGNLPFLPIDAQAIERKALVLAQLRQEQLLAIEQSLARSHYHEPMWPFGIDEWYGTHAEAYDFIEKLLRVSHTRRLTAKRALEDPWIKSFEQKAQTQQQPEQQQPQPRPLSPTEAKKNKKQTGLLKLKPAKQPKRNEGRKSKISKIFNNVAKRVSQVTGK